MKREHEQGGLVELGAASTETKGFSGPPKDEVLGIPAGLTDD